MDRRQFLTATAGIATAGMAASLAAPSIALGRGKNIVELAVATPPIVHPGRRGSGRGPC